MPRMTAQEAAHWSRVQAELLGRFNFWSRSKVSPEGVVNAAAEIADLAVQSLRNRQRKGDRK